MVTGDQILCHLIGDYILQSDWMAVKKAKFSIAAAVHVMTYGLPFLFLRPSFTAWLVIVVSHFVIDRWRLARYLCWAKNWIGPIDFTGANPSVNQPWSDCSDTGYPADRPCG